MSARQFAKAGPLFDKEPIEELVIASELDASDAQAKPRPAFLRNVCGLVTRRGKRTVLARKKCP